MKVKEMTISDVHQTVVFKNELGRLLSELDYIQNIMGTMVILFSGIMSL